MVGLNLSQAEKLLNDNNLVLGNVKYEYNDAKEGTVLSQSLVGGSSDEGQKVSLVVSKGKKEKQERPSIIEEPDTSIPDNNDSNDNTNKNVDPSTSRTPSRPSRPTNPSTSRPNGDTGHGGNNSGGSIIVPDNNSDSSSGTTSENIIGGTNN